MSSKTALGAIIQPCRTNFFSISFEDSDHTLTDHYAMLRRMALSADIDLLNDILEIKIDSDLNGVVDEALYSISKNKPRDLKVLIDPDPRLASEPRNSEVVSIRQFNIQEIIECTTNFSYLSTSAVTYDLKLKFSSMMTV